MEINNNTIKKFTIGTGIGLFMLVLASYFFFSRPSQFPVGRVITIENGVGLAEVSHYLHESKVIQFPSFFKALVFLTRNQGIIKAGDYFFEKPLSLVSVYRRVTRGIYGIEPIRVRIFEGWSNKQIGGALEKLGLFSSEEWLDTAEGYEGYLFPDTYFFPVGITPDLVVKVMQENFDRKINEEFRSEIASQGRTLDEIIIMASLIEKEANSSEDAKIISGILWKRLQKEIGLQVDATLTYITGRPSLELTKKDLAIDSPYNTYRYRGLPPAPITNPGLKMIKAAIFPQKSPYLFYLHDKKGNPHYAETFEEHKKNKVRYLR